MRRGWGGSPEPVLAQVRGPQRVAHKVQVVSLFPTAIISQIKTELIVNIFLKIAWAI